jgi:hypothetical protein
MENQIKQTINEAGRIGSILADEGISVIIIGAIALAAHGYIRATKDVDLGVNIRIKDLARIHQRLITLGYHAELHTPDLDDPLGGVIEDSCRQEGQPCQTITSLSIAPLAQLVALKLYAGGWKSLTDIVELLRRNPEANLMEIGEICRKYRLSGWNRVLEELQKD